MSLESIRIAPRTFNRGRAIVLGAVAALACSACASEETVATVPYGGAPPAMAAANDPPKKVASSPPLGYPWANSGPSLSTASANAPTATR